MDLSNPLRVASSGVEADVLAVLLRTHLPLTGARVATLAQRGQTQVRAVLRRLARHGLVDVERHGQSYTYLLNRQHVLAPGLEALHSAMATVDDRIKEAIEDWSTPPESLIVFGSAARRDGDTDSDIDLLLIRPDPTDADDETWAKQRHALTHEIENLTGNAVQVIELSATELTDAISSDQPLIREIRTDGIVLVGRDLRNVPDEVGERLQRLAAREGISVSAFATRELSKLARRADNPALLADLPDLDVEAASIVGTVEAGRAER